MISELERIHRLQLYVRLVIWTVALLCMCALSFSCRTVKHAPADASLLAGTGASVAAGTLIGGPAGGAVAIVGTIATAVATEEIVRPATAPCPPVLDVKAIPIASRSAPPWWLNPNYWWAVIVLTLAVWFLIQFIFGARFRLHVRNAVWAFMSGQIKAGFAYLLAAVGMIHSEQAQRQEPKE
jgi:hypothetical protein